MPTGRSLSGGGDAPFLIHLQNNNLAIGLFERSEYNVLVCRMGSDPGWMEADGSGRSKSERARVRVKRESKYFVRIRSDKNSVDHCVPYM